MSEFKISPEAASALADFFGFMQASKTGPQNNSEQIYLRANEQAVACTAFMRFLIEAYGPGTATEVAAFVAVMMLEVTGDEEAHVAGAEVAMDAIEGFFDAADEASDEAAEMELPEINTPTSKTLN
jgi:hypothetical protein